MKILIVLLSSTLLYGCSTTITGSFVNTSGAQVNPREGKVNIVRIFPKTPYVSYISQININGIFHLAEVKPGKYFIEPLIPNYRSKSKIIDVRDNIQVVLEVNKRKSDTAKSINLNMNIDSSRGSGTAKISPPNL